jgi:two-component system, sensor histidine kinase ChiS
MTFNVLIKKITALSAPCCIILLCIACSTDPSEKKRPLAVQGTIDLRNWDFERDGAISLNGEWEFYWDRILAPSDFRDGGGRNVCGCISVPGTWKKSMVNGMNLPGKGRATYRLIMLSGPDAREKSLTIHRIFSAYDLWVNGVLVDKKGETGRAPKSREDYIYIHNKKITSFTLHGGVNEIILHVYNDGYDSGGIDRALRLGDGEITARREFNRYTVNMVTVGLLLFGAIFNILFYFFRREDIAPLSIGMASLAWAVNAYNIQSPILPDGLAYPGNPFFINYCTVILGSVFCMMIIRSLFPDDFSTRILRAMQFISLLFIVLLFFAGFSMAERIFTVYFIVTIFFVFYGTYVFIRTIINRRHDAMLFFIGFLPLFAGGVNNILYVRWIIDTGNVLHFSMVIFCVTSTLVVSRRFSRALGTVERLSRDLEEKNVSLRKLDRLKDRLLANTSHELRTPLHGMIGLSESMLEDAAGSLPPKARENLSLIVSSGHRLANMVNDLLDMAKIQDKGLTLNLRPLDLHALSGMVVKLSLPLIGGKPVEIINGIGPEISAVHADEDRIRQVFSNLIGNAIKFTNRGTIELSARVIGREDAAGNGEMVEVSVADTGIGVPVEYREKIFDVYQQVDGSDTRTYPGTGLGLAIAKQIVELHNGTIRAVSRLGGGSVFSFTLPVSHEPVRDNHDTITIEIMDDALPEGDEHGRTRLPAGDGDSIFEGNPVFLVVDDDPVNIRVLQNYFESKRCVVKTATDGVGALEIIGSEDRVDLVLLDIMMPGMSGYEVCRRIRATRTTEELPVIMLTAKNMMSDIDAAFEAGANDYLMKPFHVNELLARTGTMLKLRNVRRSAAGGITLRGGNSAYSLKFSEIYYITSHSKSSVIHTAGDDIELPVMLKEIIDRLPPDLFVRIHKSHIVNVNYVESMSHVLSGRYRVRLRDDDETELPVGTAFLEALRKKIIN